jgi:hypothetical protein
MNPREITLAVVVASTIIYLGGLVIYDLFAYVTWGNHATISVVVRDLFRMWPWVAVVTGFVLGLLTGHIGWAQKDQSSDDTRPTS